MDRRRFIVGLGSASLGGSALIGSGAFSRVESQRDVSIQVADDPSAYLGLDKCDTPNGSYVHPDGDGHMQILMNPENPTIGQTPLGEGINSNSTTIFDRVLRICNQGKQDVCVWIADDEVWPTVPDGDSFAGERRVDFYLEDDDDRSIIGEANAVPLPLGGCVCIGLKTRSHGLSEGDELLADLANTIEIHADADSICSTNGDCEACPREDGGRLGEITFQNTSSEAKNIIVNAKGQGSSNAIFDETVPAGGEFTVDGLGPNGNNSAIDLEFFVDGSGPIDIEQRDNNGELQEKENLHISCSQEIFAGMFLHSGSAQPGNDIMIVSAEHHNGEFTIC